jgi:hypothetical protein
MLFAPIPTPGFIHAATFTMTKSITRGFGDGSGKVYEGLSQLIV